MEFRNAPKKRTTNFREDETKLLIQLWGSPTVQNKLYLTHRKAPVMRLIAANMQKHGFYRTHDEIKTRIRNLKCLYHRIKKSMTTGAGIGTVDPDWPHYKAMDDILSRKNALRQNLVYNHNLLSEVSNAEIKEEMEDIEINADDGDECTSNSNGSDDEFEESAVMPATITPLIIEDDDKIITPLSTNNNNNNKPLKSPPISSVATNSNNNKPTTYPRIQVAQNLLNSNNTPNKISITPKNNNNNNTVKSSPSSSVQIPQVKTVQINNANSSINSMENNMNKVNNNNNGKNGTNNNNKGNTTLPFPLLILNGMPSKSSNNGTQNAQNGNSANNLLQNRIQSSVNGNHGNLNNGATFNNEISSILREMLLVQKENLEIERERLNVEKQKLEFERTVGCQLLNMVPAFNEIFHRFNSSEPLMDEEEEEDTKNFSEHPGFIKTDDVDSTHHPSTKRSADSPLLSPLKGTKIFKETVIDGIKKYMNSSTEEPSSRNNNNEPIIINANSGIGSILQEST